MKYPYRRSVDKLDPKSQRRYHLHELRLKIAKEQEEKTKVQK